MLVRVRTMTLALTIAGSLVIPRAPAPAQQVAAPTPAADPGPVVNGLAPDFTLAGATRYGLLKTPVRLSDFRGSTVVLAFFFQARTKG